MNAPLITPELVIGVTGITDNAGVTRAHTASHSLFQR